MNPTIYIATCDATMHILPTMSYMFNKYWGEDQRCVVLGFSTPSFELPKNFEYVSMAKKQDSINDWSLYLYNFFKGLDDEYIIFMLDDYIPINYFNKRIFDEVYDTVKKDKKIVRYGLGNGAYYDETKYDLFKKCPTFDIVEIKQNINYRVSCQISLWRRSYLLTFLKRRFNPWQFETIGSNIAKNDGYKIIETKGQFSFEWIRESMLSKRIQGKFNVLGLKMNDIQELIDKQLLKKDDLWFGMNPGGIKYTKDFTINLLGHHPQFNSIKNLYTMQYNIKFYSQYGQDKFCYDKFFNDKVGFFVEIGADDGIDKSNTYFFEKELGWNGLCIEPRTSAYDKLIFNRRCLCENVAVSSVSKDVPQDFLELEGWGKGLSGLVDHYDPRHLQRIKREQKHPQHVITKTIKVPVVSLQQLFDKHNIVHIDFLSIDTEGGELEILETLNWDQTSIDVICIENNYNYSFEDFFKDKGYKKIQKLVIDEIYVK